MVLSATNIKQNAPGSSRASKYFKKITRFRLIVWLGQINAPAAPLEGVMLQLFVRQIVKRRLSATVCAFGLF